MELEIRSLSKKYPQGPQALDRVDLTIKPGVFGLLGPNGAGKSTLMRILATLQEPDSGSVRLGDIDPLADRDAMRKVLGYLPQDFGLYPHATAERLLDHLAELKGVGERKKRSAMVQELLEKTNLWDVRRRKLKTFSGGMRQRFGIAQALLNEPRLLIVDEPTTGLDPEERARFFNTLSEIGEGLVVILSTHIVDDISQLCGQVAILDHGKVLREGSPREALDSLRGQVWSTAVAPGEMEEVAASHQVLRHRRFLGKELIHVLASERPGPSFEPAAYDLEDVYFATLRGSSEQAWKGAA